MMLLGTVFVQKSGGFFFSSLHKLHNQNYKNLHRRKLFWPLHSHIKPLFILQIPKTMAASSFLLYNTNFNSPLNPLNKQNGIPTFRGYRSNSYDVSYQFQAYPSVKSISTVANSQSGRQRQVEIVYDPNERVNKLADEVDKNIGLGRLTLFSPCKVNVFLRITGKREDGYHDLASLFHVISLGDTIKFSLSPSKTKDRLSTNVPGVPLDEKNLIIKALNLYRQKTGSDQYFWIHLDKKVPTGAGLGGGSSNAATALWAANQFSGGIASEKELQEWSCEIGSDIPFFFSCGAAYCTGRGELVKDVLPPVPLETPLILIKPQEACSTAEVYKRLRLDKSSKVDPLTLLNKISAQGISQDVCINDLEAPAFEVLPSLKRLKKRVMAASRGQYDAVFMSGSGSTIVGIGSSDPPQFVYDEEDYRDVFLSEATFITRGTGEWYREPISNGFAAENECSSFSSSSSSRHG